MQTAIRIYLALIGVMYIGLSLWCSFAPADTSSRVGFKLEGDTGANEFMTVYGGLEFALGALFIVPLLSPDLTRYSLLLCLTIHGSLVLFRSLAFFFYSDVQPMTTRLAIGEWVILLITAACWLMYDKSQSVAA